MCGKGSGAPPVTNACVHASMFGQGLPLKGQESNQVKVSLACREGY